MKTILTILLLLTATFAMAQQQQRRNARLDSLVNEKDTVLLQQKLAKLGSGNEDDLDLLLQYYREDDVKADSLLEIILKKYPRGRFAANAGQNAIFTENNAGKQEQLFREYQQDFPRANYDMINYAIAYTYANDKNSGKALHYVDQVKGAAFRTQAIGIIADILMKYDNRSAEALTKKELDNARELLDTANTSAERRDPLANPKRDYYSFLNLYGKILMQAGNYAGALKYISEAYDSSAKKDDEMTRNYGFLLSRNAKYQAAFPLIDKVVREGKGDTVLKKELATAYEKLNPGKNGAAYLAGIKEELARKIGEEAAKLLINEPAPAFVVTDVNGKTVSLADFKGKTIVLDFWATWCGPCKKSFPAMQQAVNKFKNDADVKFLFIHTWERTATPLKDAKDYLTQNKYDFDLFMDIKDPVSKKNNAVSLFGVKGIPAKFVIDGNGHIRFRVTGFSGGDDAAVEELSAMIGLAKKKA